MTGFIHLHATGVTTWQDAGRPHWRPIGVPTSGPLHRERYQHLTALLGASTPVPVWENLAGDIHFTLTLPPHAPHTLIAISGPADLLNTHTGYLAVAANTSALLTDGTYRLHRTQPGPIYLAIDGWETPTPVLGSISTDTHSHLGPAPLAPGTHIPVHPQPTLTTPAGNFIHPPQQHTSLHHLLVHPHWDAGAEYLHEQVWHIDVYARNGIRLRPYAPHRTPTDHPSVDSFPVLPGVIQLPPDGNPIVLGPDSGTMGGYPTIGWLPAQHFDALTALPNTARIRFTATDWTDTPEQRQSTTAVITPTTLTNQQPAWALEPMSA